MQLKIRRLNQQSLLFIQRQKKERINIGDKSQHAPCQRCNKLFCLLNEKGTRNKTTFRYCLSCWRSQSKMISDVQTQDDHSGFMQQDTQIMSLHADKGIMLNNNNKPVSLYISRITVYLL